MKPCQQFFFASMILSSGLVAAQSQLPACDPASIHRDNCWGEHKMSDGSVYVGEYHNDHRSGHGKATLFNGDIYEGDFADGKYNGQGTYLSPRNHTRFVGTFKDDYRQKGTLTFDNGDQYVGDFRDDKRSGQGVPVLSNPCSAFLHQRGDYLGGVEMSLDRNLLPDPVSYFESRGQKIVGKRGKHFRTTCTIHGGDGGTLSVLREDGGFNCFSCGATVTV